MTITNDELTLTTTNGHEGVDGLEASLHGLVHRLAGNNAGGLDTDTLARNGVTQGALKQTPYETCEDRKQCMK